MKQNYFHLDPLEGEIKYKEDSVVNYFNNLVLDKDVLRFAPGHTEFNPSIPLVAGCRYNITIKYYPESNILKKGSIIKFSIPRTWSQPHNRSKELSGYVHSNINKNSTLEFTQNENLQWWIVVTLLKDLNKDDFIEIKYDNVDIQRFPQNEFINWRNSLRTVIELNDENKYYVVPKEKTQKPIILSAPASKFNVASPSVIKKGEDLKLRFCALDYCNNKAYPYINGDIFAATMDDPYKPIKLAKIETTNKNYGEITIPTPINKKHFQIIISDRKDRLQGISPEIILEDNDDNMNVYFGDIHAKTHLSDGLGTPDDYFTHLKETALCDFGAIADHNYDESSKIEGPFQTHMRDDQYAKIQAACEKFNKPGEFVTIQAFEQNYIKDYPGHRNIYFRDKCPGLFRGETLKELYDYLEGHKALVIPHHHIIWNTKVHLDNSKYSKVIEMYSMHCSSEVKGTPINNYSTTINKSETGKSAREILDMGYKVGFIAASDNHSGAPGLTAVPSRFTNIVFSAGVAAVYAPSLTRENIFDGLYNRTCYATTGKRIYLNFKVNDHMMGSEIKTKNCNELPYKVTVGGTCPIAKIELIINNKEIPIFSYDNKSFVKLEDKVQIKKGNNWMYIRVTQIDRHMAWSSPIFIENL